MSKQHRWERREQRRNSKHNRMPKHGKGLQDIARIIKEESDRLEELHKELNGECKNKKQRRKERKTIASYLKE